MFCGVSVVIGRENLELDAGCNAAGFHELKRLQIVQTIGREGIAAADPVHQRAHGAAEAHLIVRREIEKFRRFVRADDIESVTILNQRAFAPRDFQPVHRQRTIPWRGEVAVE